MLKPIKITDGKGEIYLADRDFSIFCAPDIDFRDKRNLNKHLCDTLIDGVRMINNSIVERDNLIVVLLQEMVIDVSPSGKFPRYLIYDAVRIHGRDVTNDNFHMRFERINVKLIYLIDLLTVMLKYF